MISTLQVFSNLPPHIPILHDVTMEARGVEVDSTGELNQTTAIPCKFRAYYPAGRRENITDMVTSPQEIQANILVNTQDDIQSVVLQNGKTIVTKEIDQNTPFWTSKTAVNMVLVTEECADLTEFLDPVFNLSHSYHMPATNVYNVYSAGGPQETRLVYISATSATLRPLASLANVNPDGNGEWRSPTLLPPWRRSCQQETTPLWKLVPNCLLSYPKTNEQTPRYTKSIQKPSSPSMSAWGIFWKGGFHPRYEDILRGNTKGAAGHR